ncbi:MAG: pseudouridine synthase [Myxococcota bacterium]
MAQDRLQKIIARAGVASRRGAEELIKAGRVRVNGRVERTLGTRADPRRDKVEVDGKLLQAEHLVYIVLHKPRNCVSTANDPEGRDTVLDFVKPLDLRLYPVGRLDFATSGVLLLTNDGDFAQGLLHPRRQVPKTYVVKLDREVSDRDLDPWRQGVPLDDGPTSPADVHLMRHEGGKSWIRITITEGRNQQIRRMAEATGYIVMRLARIAFADITHDDLRPGRWRPLTVDELRVLKKNYGVPRRVRAQHELTRTRARVARGHRPPAAGRGPRRRR